MCGARAIRQRPSVTFARLLEVARYTFSFGTKLATAISDCTKRAEGSGEGVRIDAEARAGCFRVTRRPEDLLWRHSCRTNSIYCPRMSVIGRYWTFANEHGGWKVYWKAASVIVLSVSWADTNLEEMRNMASRIRVIRVLSLSALRDAKASVR